MIHCVKRFYLFSLPKRGPCILFIESSGYILSNRTHLISKLLFLVMDQTPLGNLITHQLWDPELDFTPTSKLMKFILLN